MKRYLRLFLIIFLMIISINIVKAENYKTGDLISYKNIKFYVMEDNGDYLTLLKATPLTVDEVNKYGNGHVNVKIHEDYKRYGVEEGRAYDLKGYGYGGAAYYSSDNCYGYLHESDCKLDYNESDVKYIVENWSQKVLDQNDLKGVDINIGSIDSGESSIHNYKVRLITKEEVEKNISASWVTRYWYWTMSLTENSCIHILYNGHLGYSGDTYSALMVRPVIHLNKSASITKIKNNLKDINDTEFKIGDIIDYNGKEFYVLKDASKTDDKLTLVTKMPLSYEELNKMDRGSNTLIGKNLEDGINYHPGYVYYYYSNEENQKCGYFSRNFYDGCTTSYDKSLIKPIVEKWAGQFFDKELTEDKLGYKARLLTIDELKENLAYIGRGNGANVYITTTEYYEVSEKTPFILEDCFTMSPVSDSNYAIYAIRENGNISADIVFDNHGICPVVTIKKQVASDDEINNQDKINDQDNDNKNFIEKIFVPNTLLKNPIFIVVSGIILIVAATVIVSLTLKKKNNKKNKL